MTVDEHEYHKVMRGREVKIRNFMQLKLEKSLEELNWMIRCHNCEALNCPQEEYPASFLPTPPPSYIDNVQNRLIKVQEGIYPASLKMILKLNYHIPVRRPAPETSVPPDDVIGEHRAGENSPSSQCDPSPRREAVDTGSGEPGEPRRSPAIGIGSGPGVSHFETLTEEEGPFLPETSMDDFRHSNFTSPEQECILLKSDIGVDDNEKATASKVLGAGHIDIVTFLEKKIGFACFFLVLCPLPIVFFFPSCPQIAEAGTKGDMSYLDAPDTRTAVPGKERSPSRFFADKGYTRCTSVFFDCLDLKW